MRGREGEKERFRRREKGERKEPRFNKRLRTSLLFFFFFIGPICPTKKKKKKKKRSEKESEKGGGRRGTFI